MRGLLARRSSSRATSGYDAFISYSHLEDDALAATLQVGLESFGTPWFRSRTLRVFRDTTDLTATPGLLSEIIGALSTARWFILVASERAAKSRWVNEEVSWWLDNRDHERLLIALSDGQIAWVGQDFDWDHTTALPAVLAGAFTEEPGWIDLRKVKRALPESGDVAAHGRPHRLARYRARRQVGDWVAALAAPIRGMAKDNLVGEHLRYRKQTRRIVQAVLAVMLFLTVGASAAAAVAASQLAAARTQTRIATSRELAALSETLLTKHLDLAELFAVEAYRLNPSGQALAALFQAVTAGPHLVTYLAAGGTVSAVAGSADGRVIVAGRSDGTVLRWSLPATRPAVIARMSREVTGVSVNGNGSAVVADSQAAALRWDLGRGVRPLRIAAGQRPVAVSISESGRFAAVASTPPMEAPEQLKLTVFGPDARMVNATSVASVTIGPQYLTFSGDSQLTTLGSAYGAWRRLSVPGLRSLGGTSYEFGNEDVAALSPGGEFIGASLGTTTLAAWDLAKQPKPTTWNSLNIPTRGANPSALAINAQGTLIAQAADGSIYLSGITRGRSPSAPLALTGNSVVNDGTLAFAGRSELVSASGGLLTLWDSKQYARIAAEASITAPFGCAACGPPALSVQPSGARVAVVAGPSNTMTEEDLSPAAGQVVRHSVDGTYGAPLWMPDGKRLIVLTSGGGAQVWSTVRGFTRLGQWPSPAAMLPDPNSPPVLPLATAFQPGERTLLEVFTNGAILIRDAMTGKVDTFIVGPHSLADGTEASSSAAVDAEGQSVAIVTAHGVVLTSIASRHVHVLPGNSSDKVAFYGERLLIQQPDGPLQVWDGGSARLVKTIAGTTSTAAGPVVGRNGLVAETSSDGSAVVIDLNSGITLGSFRPPAGTYFYSMSIGMSPDGSSLVTVTEATFGGGDQGSLTDWRMSVGTWLKVACATAGHALSDADWQEYVGGSPPGQLACSPGSA